MIGRDLTKPDHAPSRRSLIAGIGLGAGVASGLAATPGAPQALPAGDAELVSIGERLEVVLAELSSRIEVQQFRIATAQDAAKLDPGWSSASSAQRCDLLSRYERLHGVDDDDADTEAPGLELDALRRRSEAVTATTWAGLQTKARFVAHAHGPLDEDSSELASLLRDLGALSAA